MRGGLWMTHGALLALLLALLAKRLAGYGWKTSSERELSADLPGGAVESTFCPVSVQPWPASHGRALPLWLRARCPRNRDPPTAHPTIARPGGTRSVRVRGAARPSADATPRPAHGQHGVFRRIGAGSKKTVAPCLGWDIMEAVRLDVPEVSGRVLQGRGDLYE